MDWNAVGAIGQVLGSIAVFITLAYLAVQTRQTRQEVQRSINLSRAEAGRHLLMNHANSDRFLEVTSIARKNWGNPLSSFAATMIERGGVSESDALMLYFNAHAWWQYRAQTIRYIDELPAGERFGFDASCRARYDPGTWEGLWYEVQKPSLNPDAVRYIDDLLAKPS